MQQSLIGGAIGALCGGLLVYLFLAPPTPPKDRLDSTTAESLVAAIDGLRSTIAERRSTSPSTSIRRDTVSAPANLATDDARMPPDARPANADLHQKIDELIQTLNRRLIPASGTDVRAVDLRHRMDRRPKDLSEISILSASPSPEANVRLLGGTYDQVLHLLGHPDVVWPQLDNNAVLWSYLNDEKEQILGVWFKNGRALRVDKPDD